MQRWRLLQIILILRFRMGERGLQEVLHRRSRDRIGLMLREDSRLFRVKETGGFRDGITVLWMGYDVNTSMIPTALSHSGFFFVTTF